MVGQNADPFIKYNIIDKLSGLDATDTIHTFSFVVTKEIGGSYVTIYESNQGYNPITNETGKSLSQIISDYNTANSASETLDGNYKVGLSGVYDKAGNAPSPDSVTIAFTVDNTDPELDSVTVSQPDTSFGSELSKSKDDGWTKENSWTVEKKLSTVAKSPKTPEYSISVKISGIDSSDIDESHVMFYEGETLVPAGTSLTYDASNSRIVYTNTPDDSYQNESRTYKITAKDNAGNSITKSVTVKFLKNEITVSDPVIVEADPEFKNIDGDLATRDKDFVVKYTITSDAPLLAVDAGGIEFNVEVNGTLDTSKKGTLSAPIVADGIYTYTYTYPVSVSESSKIKTTLKAEDVNGVISSEKSTDVLCIDINDPNAEAFTDAAFGTAASESDTVWYKSLIIFVKATDNETDNYYSGIDKIQITGDIEPLTENSAEVKQSTKKDNGKFESRVDILVTDKVGNDNESTKKSFVFHVDKTPPIIDATQLKVDGKTDSELDALNPARYLKVSDPDISYSISEDVKIKNYKITIKAPDVTKTITITDTVDYGENISETKKLSELLESTPKDGEYTITIEAENLVPTSADSKEIKFYIDTTAPTLDLELAQSANIPLEETGGKYTTKDNYRLTSYKDFNITVNSGDAVSGVASVKVTEKIGENEPVDISDQLSGTNLPILANNKYCGETVVYTVIVSDKMGITTTKTLTIEFSKDAVVITSVRDTANINNPVRDDEKNVTNKGVINITYTIKSDVKIADPTLNDGVATLKINGSDIKIYNNSKAVWTADETKPYDYIYTLVYTIEETESTVLTNIDFNIKNINGISAEQSSNIAIINIDLSAPSIDLKEAVSQTEWFKELDIVLSYTEGTKEYKSGVKTITITGVKQALGNFFTTELDPYDDEVKVSVDQSSDINGTPVIVDIEDQLGNKAAQKKYTFHVDEINPESTLEVAGKNYKEVDMYLGATIPNPSVKYEATDNILLAEGTLEITIPGTDVPIVVSMTDIAKFEGNTTLGALIGPANCESDGITPKDGTYKISLKAKDKAGRVPVGDAKEVIFVLDNTLPENDLLIQNTKTPKRFEEYKNKYVNPRTGKDYDYGQYYDEDVIVKATVSDTNVKTVTITDNDKTIYSGAGFTGGEELFTFTTEGKHKIVLSTVDNSNNTSDPVSLEFTIDKTAPQASIKVAGVDSTTIGANYYIGHSNTEKNPEIKLNVVENIMQYEYHVDVIDPDNVNHTDVYYEKEKEGNFEKTISLSNLCEEIKVSYPLAGELPQDGKYTISLKSDDMAGNEAKPSNPVEATFYLDNTAPKLDTNTVKLDQVGNNTVIQPTYGEDVVTFKGVTATAESESKGKFTVTYETSDPVVNNVSSGFKADGITVTEKLGETTRAITPTKVVDGDKVKVTFEVTANSDFVGKNVDYIIKSTDAVGNSISKTVRVSFAKDEISIKHRGFDNEATNSTNSKFTITYDIVSDVPITPDENAATLDAKNIKLSMETLDGAKNKDTAGTGVLVKADSYNAAEFKYNYVYAYTINLSQSDVLKNVKVTVANNNGVVSEPDLISLINIDLTDPAIAANNPNESMWFPSLQVIFNYTEGNREYMSGVKSIKITGVKQGLDDYFESEFDNGEKDSDERVLKGSVTVDVNESKDLNGTKVTTDIMDNLGRTMDTKSYTFHVDETNPVSALSVNGSSAADIDGTYIGTNTLNPTVAYSADDNIQIKNYALKITLPSGETITPVTGENVKNINKSTTLGDLIGKSNMNGSVPKDGTYTLTYEVYDMAGRVPDGGTITTTFTLDNTTPKNDLQITTGRPPKFDKFNSSYSNEYTGLSYSYGQYYNSSVSIDAIVVDNNVENITVTDNGSVIYSGTSLDTTHVISAEGSHTVAITTVDKAGLSAATESVTFTIDTTQPVLSTTLNNAAFPEGGATRYLNVNGDVGISYVETNKDTDDLIMTVTKNPPGGGSSVTSSKVNEGSQVFSDEADYTVKFAATDRAGNKSAERTVTFRVDRTKPELSFTGAADHGTSTKSVNMSYIVREAFYSDMNSCTLRIYKKVDGASEVLLKTVEIKPTSANYSMNELFEEDGEYRFEMTAEDKCGNPATASYTFILDGKAPIITLAGVKNYDKTSEDVTLTITVDETFFSSNKVVLKGTRIDIDGVKHDVKFSDFAANTGKISKFEQLFKEDGIYDITITSTDKAGNSSTQKIHFTKDTTDPEIKGIDDYDGTKINSFKWGTTAEEMVRDLTVCDIKVYMDGVEYDGLSDLADGSHVLRVIATDELGHTTDREVSFVLDTIAPNILISGVEEGQYLKEATQITVSVQIDEDTLTRVTLDGKEIEIVNGVATFTVNQRGQYTIFVEAIDEAGNVATKQLNFNFGDRFPWWIFLVGAGGIFLMILLLLLARRRKDKKAA